MMPDNKRPTLKTIAFMTGLGVTTVSRALKDAPDIGENTKQRVRLVARQIGYRPNRAGLRLRTGKTNVIGLILNTEEEVLGLTSQMIAGISQALSGTPYHLVVTPYSHHEDSMEPVRYVNESQSADGIIISRIEPNDPRVRYLHEKGMPFATHGRSDMGIEHAYHDFDNTAFGGDAVGILAEQNCKMLSIIAPPQTLAYAHHMLDGYFGALERFGISHMPAGMITVDDPVEQIAARVEQLLSSPQHPDGIVCGSVSAAVGATLGVEAAGLVVGRDIQIVAKQSSAKFLKWFGRPIHTISEDFTAAGFDLAQSVIALVDGDAPANHQRLYYPADVPKPGLAM